MEKEKIRLFVLLVLLLLSFGCVQKENSGEQETSRILGTIKASSESDQSGLGNLCVDEEECQEFCSKNRGKCESYCRGKEIELCRIIFPPTANDLGPQGNAGCIGYGTVIFTSPPMHIEEISFIEPIGLMIAGHVTPIDHGYYTAKTWLPGSSREDPNQFVDILSPVSGVVTLVQSMPDVYASSSLGDYRIIIHHTCTFYTIYIHVNQLSEKLQAIADTRKTVTVQAGEVIGRAPGFDFSVHNDEITLKGFIVPENYIAEPWKLHNVDIFDYFVEPIRTQLLDKNVRQKEPRGGKIDYDIDGRLVGNWFVEGTNGYYGLSDRADRYGYYATHLAFAYEGLDPSLVIVSMGDYNGEPQQFAVKGNSPDPADIDIAKGLVKYELVPYDYFTDTDKPWDRQHFAKIAKVFGNDEQVSGVVLVQMLEDRKIKFEAFPGKSAAQVSGFTEKAKIYER